jgi:transcriptional regulator with XRE-family HTH domain
MNFDRMTDEAIATEIGRRIEQLRLERNFTQQYMADAAGLSRVSYRKLEAGEVKFVNLIAALRALDQLHTLEQMLPNTVFSPIEQLKLKGKVRKRATGSRGRAGGLVPNPNSGEQDW